MRWYLKGRNKTGGPLNTHTYTGWYWKPGKVSTETWTHILSIWIKDSSKHLEHLAVALWQPACASEGKLGLSNKGLDDSWRSAAGLSPVRLQNTCQGPAWNVERTYHDCTWGVYYTTHWPGVWFIFDTPFSFSSLWILEPGICSLSWMTRLVPQGWRVPCSGSRLVPKKSRPKTSSHCKIWWFDLTRTWALRVDRKQYHENKHTHTDLVKDSVALYFQEILHLCMQTRF